MAVFITHHVSRIPVRSNLSLKSQELITRKLTFSPSFPGANFLMLPGLHFSNFYTILSSVLNAPLSLRLCYPYEEFADHMKAMRTVREWEYTSRFGHLGSDQTSRANSARVVEYFFDSYIDKKEAVHKAELFLSIYDYIGRNQEAFSKKGLMEKLDNGPLSVETALLRAIHHVFTVVTRPAEVDPKKVLALAKAFQDIQSV